MKEDFADKIKEITDQLDENTIKNASNEELMGYLFLVEKMKKKLEDMVSMED